MPDPMQPIYDTKQELETRQKRRGAAMADDRVANALEIVADEMTMMRAEMTVMRGLLAQIAVASDKPRPLF
jgi:hypothetical protein